MDGDVGKCLKWPETKLLFRIWRPSVWGPSLAIVWTLLNPTLSVRISVMSRCHSYVRRWWSDNCPFIYVSVWRRVLGLNFPARLDVFESELYWVSEVDGTLTTMDKFGRGVNRTLQTGLVRPHAIKLFHRSKHDIASTYIDDSVRQLNLVFMGSWDLKKTSIMSPRHYWLVAWHSGRTSVFGRRTFPVLRLTCSWRVTTYVGKPSAIGQPTTPTQPFIPSGSIDD